MQRLNGGKDTCFIFIGVMNFGSSSFANIDPLNALQELNAYFDTTEDSNIRNTMYAFDEECAEEIPVPVLDDELLTLQQHVTKGRELLEATIIEYHKAKSLVDEAKQMFEVDQRRIALIMSSFENLNSDKFQYTKHKFLEANVEMRQQCDGQIKVLTDACLVHEQKLRGLRQVYKIFKTSDSTFACPICLKNQVECFLNPCGHTYCTGCIMRAEQKCFICRKQYTRVHNLFFS